MSRTDRLLAIVIACGAAVYAWASLHTPYAFNDWDWLVVTRSLDRWFAALTQYENVRVSSQAILGATFSLFGPRPMIPATILVVLNLASMPLLARVLRRLGFTQRAAWLAAAMAVFCTANDEVAMFLASSETALGRTAVLLVLDQALDDGPRADIRAAACLFLAFLTHETAVLAVPLFLVVIFLRDRALPKGRVLLLDSALAFTVARVALFWSVPHGPHGLTVSAIPQNLAFFASAWVKFHVEHGAVVLLVLALVLGARPGPEDRRTARNLMLSGSVAALIAYAPYFGATAYRNPYFFTLSAACVAVPLGWAADRALTLLENRPSRAMAMALAIAVATVWPIHALSPSAPIRALTQATRSAAGDAIARDGAAGDRCLWMISPDGAARLPGGAPVSAVLDARGDRTTNMLQALYPESRFVLVELDPAAFAHVAVATRDAVVRIDEHGVAHSEAPTSATKGPARCVR